MFVASYLPLPEHRIRNADPGIRAPLYEALGAEPVWCFCADTALDLWRNSLLSVPVCPEVLYVADVDDSRLLAEMEAYKAKNANNPKKQSGMAARFEALQKQVQEQQRQQQKR